MRGANQNISGDWGVHLELTSHVKSRNGRRTRRNTLVLGGILRIERIGAHGIERGTPEYLPVAGIQ